MYKLCPSCRMKNDGDASVCAGCGEDISKARLQNDGSGITMFGGPPPQTDIKPLEKAAAAPTHSYGAAKASVDEEAEDVAALSQEAASAGSTHRPRKPWE